MKTMVLQGDEGRPWPSSLVVVVVVVEFAGVFQTMYTSTEFLRENRLSCEILGDTDREMDLVYRTSVGQMTD
jgi:hypothetical protein